MGLQQLYLLFPAWAQNMAVSTYGFKLHFDRYYHADRRFQQEITSNLGLSPEELEAYRLEKLKAIIHRAAKSTPFYREYFRREHLSPADFRSVSDLRKLPVITRDDLRRDPLQFVADDIPARCLLSETTSGSTGAPISVYYTKDVLRRHYLFYQRLRALNGIQPGMRRVTFNSRIIMSPSRKKPPFWRYDASENNWHFSNYHLTPDTIELYCRKILQVGPKEIVSYPSSLYLIGRHILESGLPRPNPISIITSGENLLDEHRSIIEEAFGCRVTDQYGCTEKIVFAHTCSKGHYHLHDDYSVVEVLDPSGNPVTEGVGEAVATTLFNHAMPLVRYKIGDLIEIGRRETCSCGLPFSTFNGITGRKDDYILTPSGRKIYRLAIWEGMNSVVESQLVQTATDHLVIRIVRDSNYSSTDEEHILARLRTIFADEMRVSAEYVDHIPKEPNGKFKFISRTF